MDPYIYALYSLFYFVLFLWGLKLSLHSGFTSLTNVLLLVTFGLIYDNTVLAAGSIIGEGSLLKGLNLMRYWIHALFTPLLILFSWAAVRKSGLTSISNRKGEILAWLFTAAMILTELIQNTIGIKIEPARKYGVLSYEPAASHVPPIMIIGVTLALLAAGLILWKRLKWKWLAIGVILMGIGSTVPFPFKSDAATNGFELVLLISLWATKSFLDQYKNQAST
ncbi:hypothetical protein [Mesobacillus subterraneus]|uniref:Phospholipid phosphatase n=1 Tax=Mesobacillus subterraneus TaxID=285983 RepID=A0A427TXI9_9BACI|nr:hypothetical protein [Mesobacillus subterraneus]RSD29181.1 hypothetical protein EJA10_00565 [Mesobacillus subterraneus]